MTRRGIQAGVCWPTVGIQAFALRPRAESGRDAAAKRLTQDGGRRRVDEAGKVQPVANSDLLHGLLQRHGHRLLAHDGRRVCR